MDADALDDRIDYLIQKPSSASNDMGSVTMPNVKDLHEIAQKELNKAAATGANENGGVKSGWNMLRPGRFVSQGDR